VRTEFRINDARWPRFRPKAGSETHRRHLGVRCSAKVPATRRTIEQYSRGQRFAQRDTLITRRMRFWSHRKRIIHRGKGRSIRNRRSTHPRRPRFMLANRGGNTRCETQQGPLTTRGVEIALTMTGQRAASLSRRTYVSLYGLYFFKTSHMTGNQGSRCASYIELQWSGVVRRGGPTPDFVCRLMLGACHLRSEKSRKIQVHFRRPSVRGSVIGIFMQTERGAVFKATFRRSRMAVKFFLIGGDCSRSIRWALQNVV